MANKTRPFLEEIGRRVEFKKMQADLTDLSCPKGHQPLRKAMIRSTFAGRLSNTIHVFCDSCMWYHDVYI